MNKSIVAVAMFVLATNTGVVHASDGRSGSWHNAAQGAPSLKSAQKAVEERPQDAIANNDLGWAYRQNGDLAQAEKYLRQAIKLDPKMAAAHSNLSVVLLDKGHVQDAQSEAAQAVNLDATSPIYKVVLGNAFAKNDDRKAAIEQYRQAIKLKPDYENALYNLGRVLIDDGQIQEAKFVLSDALKLDEKDDRVIELLDKVTKEGESVR